MNPKSDLEILMIYPYPKRGGCFRQICAAIEDIISANGKVHYLSSKPFPLNHSDRIIFHKFPLYSEHEVLFYPFFYLLSPLFLCLIAARNNIKKALVFNEEFAALFFLAKILCGIKILLLIQGNMESLIRSKRLNRFIAFFLRLYGRAGVRISDRCWAVSKDLTERVKKCYKTNRHIACFYNAVSKKEISESKYIDLHRRYGLDGHNFVSGFVGSLIPRKNVGYLIEEFSRVACIAKTLLIIGGGKEKPGLEALAGRICKKGEVVFAGEPADYLDIAKSLDLLVLPTLHDDCPRIILEALGLGTPCIASNTGGIPEILYYDELMFDPKKQGVLAEKLKRIIDEPGYLDFLRKLCLERKTLFNKDWGEEIVKLLRF